MRLDVVTIVNPVPLRIMINHSTSSFPVYEDALRRKPKEGVALSLLNSFRGPREGPLGRLPELYSASAYAPSTSLPGPLRGAVVKHTRIGDPHETWPGSFHLAPGSVAMPRAPRQREFDQAASVIGRFISLPTAGIIGPRLGWISLSYYGTTPYKGIGLRTAYPYAVNLFDPFPRILLPDTRYRVRVYSRNRKMPFPIPNGGSDHFTHCYSA